jgi:hypothetical protein
MPTNEVIITVQNIICDKPNRPRSGWCMGGDIVYIDNKHYPTLHIFSSNRSKCFKEVVKFLVDNNIPHMVEQVNRQWEGARVFKQWDITLL